MQLKHPNSALCGNNGLTLKYLSQVQKCVEELNQIGLSVINIHFDKIKPTVRVKACAQTAALQRENQAICYIKGNDNQHFSEWQILVAGIRVIWRDYLH